MLPRSQINKPRRAAQSPAGCDCANLRELAGLFRLKRGFVDSLARCFPKKTRTTTTVETMGGKFKVVKDALALSAAARQPAGPGVQLAFVARYAAVPQWRLGAVL